MISANPSGQVLPVSVVYSTTDKFQNSGGIVVILLLDISKVTTPNGVDFPKLSISVGISVNEHPDKFIFFILFSVTPSSYCKIDVGISVNNSPLNEIVSTPDKKLKSSPPMVSLVSESAPNLFPSNINVLIIPTSAISYFSILFLVVLGNSLTLVFLSIKLL